MDQSGDNLISLQDRVAIITGASLGIGRATALTLADRGAKLVLSARNPGPLDDVVKQVQDRGADAIAVTGDVSNAAGVDAAVQAAVDQFGTVDIVVNNIGQATAPGFNPGALLSMTEQDFDGCLSFNVKSHWLMAKATVPLMQKAGKGAIVNVGSSSGRYAEGQVSGVGFYMAAKAALAQLTYAMALEWSPTVRVNCMAPGLIETEAVAQYVTGAHRESYLAMSAMHRLGDPREAAETIAFLASDAAGYITGATIDVTGGRAPFFSFA